MIFHWQTKFSVNRLLNKSYFRYLNISSLFNQCKALPFDGSSGISDASQIETDTPTVIVTSNVTGLAGLDDEDVYIVTVEDAEGFSPRNGAEQASGSTNLYNLNNFDQLPAILRNIKENICRGNPTSD